MRTLISFDIKADFVFLKKPDTNDPMYLTFNMLHKPAFLGILGAIVGLGGFSEFVKEKKKGKKSKAATIDNSKNGKFSEYYTKLNHIPVGIKPLGDENGNFQKTIIKYTNQVGYANDDGTLIVTEQTLIKPAYRCYLLLDLEQSLEKKLFDNIKNYHAEYLPYLGKNDFSLWWENFLGYQFEKFNPEKSYKLISIFIKEQMLKDNVKKQPIKPLINSSSGKFMYFENLPVSYHKELLQYEYEPFAYTDWEVENIYPVENLYKLSSDEIIQLF